MFGLFVQRHAEAAALYNDISVIYVHPDENVSNYEIVHDNDSKDAIHRVSTIRVYYRKSRFKPISLFRFFRANHLALKRLPKPDIIHVHILTRLGIIALWHKIINGTPYIITEHWSRYLPGNIFNGFLRKKLTKTVVKHASLVTTVTENLANAMRNHGLRNKNYMVLPNVVDVDVFDIILHKNAIPRIIHVSCFEDKSKNISGLLNALKLLKDKNIAFEAVLIGEGMDFEAMKHKANDLRLDDCVKFTGMLQGRELVNVMANGDFLVLSSNYENLPVVILEAFACGLPVVSTNVGGIAEIINDSNGLLVPSQDHYRLADAMQKMMQTYHDYDANILRDAITKKFSNESVGKLLDGIYKKLN